MSRATFTLLGLPVLALVLLAAVATTPPAAAPFQNPSFRFAKHPAGPPEPDSAAPISLTASDGTGLALVALEANGVLEPPLAFTEFHLTFENPRDQRIEGRFRIALPPGAALSRFAMKNDWGWQEGEVVERQKARVAYEDFLHRRQDPALLEQEAGNEFSARVFPIPARGRKEIIVSYSHALPRAEEPYVIPLHGLSEIGRLNLRVFLGGRAAPSAPSSNLGGEVSERKVVELHKQDWTPDRDFEIGQDRVAGRAGLRHDNLVVARVSVPVEAVPQEIAGLYVLVDSSASRTLGYATQIRRLNELVTGLRDGAGASTPVGVAAFDQEVVSIFEGPASEFGGTETQALADRRPLGASDLHQALTWLDKRLARSGGKYPRVLLITDGVATAGETGTDKLKAAVHTLGSHGVERLDVLAVGGLRDETVLRELTTGNLKHDGQRIDGAAPLAEISRRLTLACRSGIRVKIDGAAWSWPETLDGVQPGDEVLVYADLPADHPLRLTLDGRAARLGEIMTTELPLLQRAWAQARIDRLIHLRDTAPAGDEDLRRALTLQITEVSVKNRVISPYTAMLVLETEYDYARFGLDRRALADILTVGPGGLEVMARKGSDLPRIAQPVDTVKREEPALQSLGYVAGGTGTVAQPVEVPDSEAVEGGVEGGVAGSVPGGVAGGVVSGVGGGTPGGVPGTGPADRNEAPASPTSRGGSPRVERDQGTSQAWATPPPPPPPAVPRPAPRIAPPAVQESIAVREDEEKEAQTPPYTGTFAKVREDLAAGRIDRARETAEAWSAKAPGDVLALLALGEAWEAAGERKAAARAYGSLIDLFPSRADLRRLTGERLERLGQDGLGLAIDTYRKAVLDRPDHPSGHRLLAWALLRAGRYEEAFAALEEGIEQRYPSNRFLGVDRVLREDLGLIGAAWLRAEPGKREQVLDRLRSHEAHLETGPSVRFVLTWETDANDVDLHVWDRKGDHAYYKQKNLPSGGELYADVTTGYGPECFTIPAPESRDAAPYRLAAHYYNRGPMGYGMGTVQIVRHDGKGSLTVEPRPFVVMTDQAMVDLGVVGGKGVKSGK